jgi:hypothetical protein
MATMAVTLNEPNPVSSSVAWRAVEGRDASYDGRFVYAVSIDRRVLQALVPFSTGAALQRRVLFDDGRGRASRLSRVPPLPADGRIGGRVSSRDRESPRVAGRTRRPIGVAG